MIITFNSVDIKDIIHLVLLIGILVGVWQIRIYGR